MAFSARLPNPSKGYDMFKAASGLNYYRFLKRLHENFLFDWYMEVGCRAGKSFSLSRSKTIAVDPFFRAEINIITANCCKGRQKFTIVRRVYPIQPPTINVSNT